MQVAELHEEREKLIEAIGVFVEKERLIAPLAARIFATLIINGSRGTTFEQLVNDLGASKSTIFTHLNTLEAQQKISYYTKCGDRKRYYYITPGYISRKIKVYTDDWKKERVLQKKILEYKRKYNESELNEPLSIKEHEIIIDFLTQFIAGFEKLDEKYQKIIEKKTIQI